MSALELAGAPVVAAYAAWAGSYDDVPNATRDAEAAAVRAWVEAGVVRSSGARVLELGAGTGKNTVLWAAAAESVVACDATGAMLAHARTRLADASHITFAEFDMCVSEWPLPRDELFDVAACSLVLEHIGSLEPLFAQVAARLRPGGCFYVGELHPHRQYANKQARFMDAEGNEVLVQAFVHHTSDYVRAACAAGLELCALDEWFDADAQGVPDRSKVPRLVTLLFRKPVTNDEQKATL